MNSLLARLRIRMKIRLFAHEWKFDKGNPLANNVVLQIAVTVPPKILGFDLEVFV